MRSTSPLTFRPMTEADLDPAAALWHEGWVAGHADVVPAELTRLRTLDSFRERLTRRRADCVVTVKNDTCIGFTMFHDNEIDQFYIGSAARGTGAAMAQMDEAERRLRAAGHASAWLACSVGNTRAARFYEKAGWTRAATERMSFETSQGPFALDVWRYEKTL
ncbi:GNAT family N-acetyltransferase [Rhodalgimonas zhirmunskyi]|uniref:GNAT family N-acetyltransferase n=1 Tax=Rhodalgimonas zhirmunskyi TaxID=2964767 RepID=A0AAJ1U725_9RHOB|nr:GNAT family N-acetyltransferase [Rhodoalgimonas zhirmunskyi]MDQ2094780.1 GNAT family N-acetyltransferase [Rhodoalgimonas zhirmunskyi]